MSIESQSPQEETKLGSEFPVGTQDLQELALAQMGYLKVYTMGELVDGSIVQVTDDSLIIDIGTKTEGIITREEISLGTSPDMSVFVVGDRIQAVVISEDEEGNYTLSKRRADQRLVWDKVDDSLKNGSRLIATGFKAVKGGLLVDIGTIAFLPQSLLDIKRIDDLEPLVGQKFEVKVLEYDREAKPHPKIVVSRRSVIEEDLTRDRDDLYDNFTLNAVVDGKIIKLTNYGAFVDIGGLQGLLHISEMSLGRIKHPSDVMKEGDTVKVKILKIDKKRKRVSLGRRELLPNPWEEIARKYKPGMVLEGVVVRTAEFGAFIKLDDYFEGLAHISELVDNKISHAKEVFNTGDKVNVLVMNVDKKNKRIKLSVKRAVDAQRKAEVREFLKSQGDLGDMFGTQLQEALRDSDLEIKNKSAKEEKPAKAKASTALAEEPVTIVEPEPEPAPADEPVAAVAEVDSTTAVETNSELNGTPI